MISNQHRNSLPHVHPYDSEGVFCEACSSSRRYLTILTVRCTVRSKIGIGTVPMTQPLYDIRSSVLLRHGVFNS